MSWSKWLTVLSLLFFYTNGKMEFSHYAVIRFRLFRCVFKGTIIHAAEWWTFSLSLDNHKKVHACFHEVIMVVFRDTYTLCSYGVVSFRDLWWQDYSLFCGTSSFDPISHALWNARAVFDVYTSFMTLLTFRWMKFLSSASHFWFPSATLPSNREKLCYGYISVDYGVQPYCSQQEMPRSFQW